MLPVVMWLSQSISDKQTWEKLPDLLPLSLSIAQPYIKVTSGTFEGIGGKVLMV